VHIVLNVTVPGQVVGLTPVASAHSVTVEWKKPSYNGECVTRYDISWGEAGSGQTGSNTTTEEEYSFTIESLDACVKYDISVSAVNRKDESNATTVSATTETDGKYHVPGGRVNILGGHSIGHSEHKKCMYKQISK
jgi:hypothetical protein